MQQRRLAAGARRAKHGYRRRRMIDCCRRQAVEADTGEESSARRIDTALESVATSSVASADRRNARQFFLGFQELQELRKTRRPIPPHRPRMANELSQAQLSCLSALELLDNVSVEQVCVQFAV